MAKVNLITGKDSLPSESAKDMELLYSDSGEIKVRLTTPILNRYLAGPNNSIIVFSKGLHLRFYDDSMKVESELTCKYAIKRDKENTMMAQNDVVVINNKGEKLNTEELIWDQAKKRIYSDKFVKITTKNEIIFGDGFESNESFTKYKLKKIKGTINLKDNGQAN
jgi:LPS export ABC transporter protein LptC